MVFIGNFMKIIIFIFLCSFSCFSFSAPVRLKPILSPILENYYLLPFAILSVSSLIIGLYVVIKAIGLFLTTIRQS